MGTNGDLKDVEEIAAAVGDAARTAGNYFPGATKGWLLHIMFCELWTRYDDVRCRARIPSGRRADMIVERKLLVALRSARARKPLDRSRLEADMRSAGLTEGVLIDFGADARDGVVRVRL